MTAKEIHDQAMLVAFESDDAKRYGDESRAKELSTLAFQKEKEAAMMLREKLEAEPTRSVLFRSAAWLAIDAGLYAEAAEMAAFGLENSHHHMVLDDLKEVADAAKKGLEKSITPTLKG